MKMTYEVKGIEKVRSQFREISDEVTTSRRDLGLAMRKARRRHKRAVELSVKEVRRDG